MAERRKGFDWLVTNAMSSRYYKLMQLMDPRRNYDDEFGYPKSSSLDAQQLWDLYDRDAIAARVVEVFPMESWNVTPTVYDNEDAEAVTEFEKAWDALGQSLSGAKYYKTEEGSSIWEYLRRVDVLSGVSRYGVLLLGLDDGKKLIEPVEGGVSKLLFLRAFDESAAQITKYETDPTNPRFGLPTEYLLTFTNPNDADTLPGATESVHWTRVIHVADNRNTSEVFGAPRMRPVLNRILDLVKLYGGSAEMYWKGAFPGMSIETNPNLGPDAEIDAAALKEEIELYQNGLQRFMALVGMNAKTLTPTVSDPTPQIKVQIEAICIKLGIPMRIFMGSERGELSSTTDKDTWAERIATRQNMYLTPYIIVPLVERLIELGVLPKPLNDEFFVDWPPLVGMSDGQKIELAQKKTEALRAYIEGGVDQIITPRDYMTRFLEMDDEEVTEIIEAGEQKAEEDLKEEEAKAQQDFQKQKELESVKAKAGPPVAPPNQKQGPPKPVTPPPNTRE